MTTRVPAPRGRGNTRSGASFASGLRILLSHFVSMLASSSEVPSWRETEFFPPSVEVVPLMRITSEVPEYCVMRSTIRPQLRSSYRFLKTCCQEWHEEQFF